MTVFYYELKADLAAYLALAAGDPIKTLKDVIEFNERIGQQEMPYFGQDIFLKAEEKVRSPPKNIWMPCEESPTRPRRRHRCGHGQIKLDALVAPTGGPAWVTDLINGDHFSGGSSSAAAVAGYPNINVTAGNLWGLPVGISFFGRAWSEPTLLKIAYSFEQLTKARRKPRFLPTIDFATTRAIPAGR